MNENFMQLSWSRAWSGVEARGTGEALQDSLIQAYQEPQRDYHTLQHLVECLEWLSQYRHLAQRPEEIEMALWFHDAVYEVKGHDNELKSAQWAERALLEAAVEKSQVERIKALIMATQHQKLAKDRDSKLIVDIDLAILGSESSRFEEYERQIRSEYGWVPDAVFYAKRAEVLHLFLDRKPLYLTENMRDMLEERAHRNLTLAVRKLAQKIRSFR